MKHSIIEYIKKWERNCYYNGIPDECPQRLTQLGKVPSYKQIAICILKNDLRDIGIYGKKSKYYSLLKKIELEANSNTTNKSFRQTELSKVGKQLRINWGVSK